MTYPIEKELDNLLNNLSPILNNGDYVFSCVSNDFESTTLSPIASFLELEGKTFVLRKASADDAGLSYTGIFSWITLNVYSDLNAVGLTAAVSTLLAENNISCNMIAAFYHDHLFVPKHDAKRAMALLSQKINPEQ